MIHVHPFNSCMILLAGILALSGPSPAPAHDSPEHEVERLTALMVRSGKTPARLMDRAVEHRALGRLDRASEDLREAVGLAPDLIEARLDLSRVRLSAGDLTNAMTTLAAAFERVTGEAERQPLYRLRAEIHAAMGRFDEALADCDRAFQPGTRDLDWYLIRSRIQAQTGNDAARIRGLREGMEVTGGFVLEIEWIEALIDGGRFREALGAIEPQLEASRLQGSWRIRRARALLGLERREEAQLDLKRALDEINSRLNPDRPDLTLLVDRGMARALSGDAKGAANDLEAARRRGAEGWMLWRLERVLGGHKNRMPD